MTATGDIQTGDIPTGDIPTGDIPTGDIPIGDIPIGEVQTDEVRSATTDGGVDRAARELQVRGWTVLDPVLDSELLGTLRSLFEQHLDEVVATGDPSLAHPTGRNRYNVWIPLQGAFVRPEVVAHPAVLAVVRRLLGHDVICSYYASDIAYPESEHQPVHVDVSPLFPGLAVALPPANVVLDIPLVDFHEDNGPLEIWSGGTHLLGDVGVIPHEPSQGGPQFRTTPGQLFAESLPSERLTMPAGSLLLRDTRVWHRGTPNVSTSRRSMLALVYSRPWYRADLLPVETSEYEQLGVEVKSLLRMARRTDRRGADRG